MEQKLALRKSNFDLKEDPNINTFITTTKSNFVVHQEGSSGNLRNPTMHLQKSSIAFGDRENLSSYSTEHLQQHYQTTQKSNFISHSVGSTTATPNDKEWMRSTHFVLGTTPNDGTSTYRETFSQPDDDNKEY
jgi:hypothetical protein